MTTLVLVMKHPGNIRVMKDVLTPEGFTVVGVSDVEVLEPVLADAGAGCIGLVDVSGFGPSIWGMCETLHARGVRFVVLSASGRKTAGGDALSRGAASFLEKPVGKSVLLQLLRSLAS